MGGNIFPRGAPSVPQTFQAPAEYLPTPQIPVGEVLPGEREERGGTQKGKTCPGNAKPGTYTWTSPFRPRLPSPLGRVGSEAPPLAKIQGHEGADEFKGRSETLS